ncbi:MAG: TIGR02646 family protein [Acidobacteria bacterium]|nr:TIGR02646 family protein [Acidobacteriota bacterium]
MRTIRKGTEPASLTEYRCAPGANYDDYRDRATLRASLVDEQRGLCCYCLSRIRPGLREVKIEHWHCQADYRAQQLDYSNLLGACMGNDGKRGRDLHCDSQKGDRDLSRNPADPAHRVEDLIRFSSSGQVLSDDAGWDTELTHVLNLNLPFLTNNRKATLRAFTEALPKRGPLTRPALGKWLREWNGESGTGELPPYCQVVVFWLRKRLARP